MQKFGLPEVKLGLIPDTQGTQHLPRLIGSTAALEMVALGKPIGADPAFQIGLIDRIANGDLTAETITFVRSVSSCPPRQPSARDG